MDLPQLPPQLFINGDWNFLFQCAKALKQLVDQFNRLPNFYSKGKWSLRILEIMKKQIESVSSKKKVYLNIWVIFQKNFFEKVVMEN